METPLWGQISISNIGFKSYYVVWKRPRQRPKLPLSKFKSYYVVWKLSGTGHPVRQSLTFKSYYVVWKRRGGVSHKPGLFRV